MVPGNLLFFRFPDGAILTREKTRRHRTLLVLKSASW